MGTRAFVLAKLAKEARDWDAAVRESGVKID